MAQVKNIERYLKSGYDLGKVPPDRQEEFLLLRQKDGRPFKRENGEWWVYPTPDSGTKRLYQDESEVPKGLVYLAELRRKGRFTDNPPDAYVWLPAKRGHLGGLYDINKVVYLDDYIASLKTQIQEKDELIASLSEKLAALIERFKSG